LNPGLGAADATWTRELGAGEKAALLAAGDTWVAVATSSHLIRVFGLGGLETDVFFAPGPVLTLCGGGRKLLVAYHGAPAVAGSGVPEVHVKCFDVPGKRALACARAPLLHPEARLTWAGFAEPQGMPCIMDADGVLSGLTPAFGGSWVPVLDTRPERKAKSEVHWPVAVNYGKLSSVVLKGAGRAPEVIYPRPLVTSRALVVPSAQPADAALAGLEAKAPTSFLTGGALQRSHKGPGAAEAAAPKAVEMDQLLLKVMQMACGNDK